MLVSVCRVGTKRVAPVPQVFLALPAPLVSSRRHVEDCTAVDALTDAPFAQADEVVRRVEAVLRALLVCAAFSSSRRQDLSSDQIGHRPGQLRVAITMLLVWHSARALGVEVDEVGLRDCERLGAELDRLSQVARVVAVRHPHIPSRPAPRHSSGHSAFRGLVCRPGGREGKESRSLSGKTRVLAPRLEPDTGPKRVPPGRVSLSTGATTGVIASEAFRRLRLARLRVRGVGSGRANGLGPVSRVN